MKTLQKRIPALLLALLVMIAALPAMTVSASDTVYSGTVNGKAGSARDAVCYHWTFDTQTGTLALGGTCDLYYYCMYDAIRQVIPDFTLRQEIQIIHADKTALGAACGTSVAFRDYHP